MLRIRIACTLILAHEIYAECYGFTLQNIIYVTQLTFQVIHVTCSFVQGVYMRSGRLPTNYSFFLILYVQQE